MLGRLDSHGNILNSSSDGVHVEAMAMLDTAGTGCLNASNFEKAKTGATVHWKNILRLKIDAGDKLMTPPMLTSFKHTLTSVEFHGKTSLKNLNLLLTHCTHLEALNFSSIQLLHSSSSSHSYFQHMVIRNISRIVLSSSSSSGSSSDLSPDEQLLLHYFNQRIKFESLKTLCLSQATNNNNNSKSKKSHSSSKKQILISLRSDEDFYLYSELMESLPPLTDFLAKNRSTLKNLEIRRPQVLLFLEHLKAKAQGILLTKLICDLASPGIEFLLAEQKTLAVLHCYNSQHSAVASATRALSLCIKRCSSTLKEVSIEHRVKTHDHHHLPAQQQAPQFPASTTDEQQWHIPSSSPNQSPGSPSSSPRSPSVSFSSSSTGRNDSFLHSHEMSTYSDCNKLQKLDINITMKIPDELETEIEESPPCSFSPGSIINCSGTIQVSQLTNLTIRFDVIQNEEMTALAANFRRMRSMRLFLFQGNLNSPYRVKLSYVEDLAHLPKIEVFELCFCEMEDIEAIELYRESSPELEQKLSVTAHSVIYWNHGL